jgi:hypothetical protein
MGLFLFILACVLTFFIGALSLIGSIVYYLVTLKWKTGVKVLNKFFYKCALSVDQTGNVLCSVPFQFIFTKGLDVHPFGDEDDTVSYVIAMNQKKDTLTWMGRLLAAILDLLDRNHLQKALDSKFKRDLEAKKRIDGNDLITHNAN